MAHEHQVTLVIAGKGPDCIVLSLRNQPSLGSIPAISVIDQAGGHSLVILLIVLLNTFVRASTMG